MSGMNINNRTGWIRPLPGSDPQLSEIPAGLKSSATSADGKRGDPGGSITILNHWQLIQRRVGTEAGGGAYANEERQSRPQSAHLHTTNKPPIKFDRWPTCNQSFSSSCFVSHLMDSSLFVSAGSSVATAAPPPFTSSQIPAMSLADY